MVLLVLFRVVGGDELSCCGVDIVEQLSHDSFLLLESSQPCLLEVYFIFFLLEGCLRAEHRPTSRLTLMDRREQTAIRTLLQQIEEPEAISQNRQAAKCFKMLIKRDSKRDMLLEEQLHWGLNSMVICILLKGNYSLVVQPRPIVEHGQLLRTELIQQPRVDDAGSSGWYASTADSLFT